MLFEPHHSPERDTHFAVQQMENPSEWVPRAQNRERPPLAPEQVPCPSRWSGMLKGERLYPEAEVGQAGGDP